MYNLFLDDYRPTEYLNDTKTWVLVKSYDEFVNKITKDGVPSFVSFDHDLHSSHYPETTSDMLKEIDYSHDKYKIHKCGYHCAVWLVEYCKEKNVPLPEWQVHSLNITGRYNISKVMKNGKI